MMSFHIREESGPMQIESTQVVQNQPSATVESMIVEYKMTP